MKKLPALLLLLPALAQADYFPLAAQKEFETIHSHITGASLQFRELILETDLRHVSREQGKNAGLAACEIATLSDSWNGVYFDRMRIENAEGFSGMNWRVTKKECDRITLGDDSDSELDRKYFNRERFTKF